MMHGLALLLGAIYCLGFAPFDVWPLTLVAIAGVYGLLQRKGSNPVWLAWWFGVGKYGLGASWIYVSINVYGNAPPPLAAFLVALFVAFVALLFCAPWGWLYARLRPAAPGRVADVLCFAFAWVSLDWASTWLLTGFPWLLPGYALMETYLVSVAPVAGVLGIGLVIVPSCAAFAAMLTQRRVRPGMAALAVGPWLLAVLLTPLEWVVSHEQYNVALVQGNLDQTRKWLPEEAGPNVRKHLDLSEGHWDADVLVWPEAAITLYPQQAQGLLDNLAERGRSTQTNLVVGIPGIEALPEGGYEFKNLAIGLGAARGRFAKHHLVPFGEYVPLEGVLRGMIEFFDLPMSSSTPGAAGQPNLMLGLGEAAMAICYEIAYPASMRQRGATAAVLMTISNDTWFGASIGPPQHMQIARMRAVENGRWLLRATNNGITGIVDHRGRVTAVLPQFEAGVLRGEMYTMQGRTPFSRLGHWPVLAILLALAVGLSVRRYRGPSLP